MRLLVSVTLTLSTSRGPRRGPPFLHRVDYHIGFGGLFPHDTIRVPHVPVKPGNEFLPQPSVGRVLFVRLLCHQGVESVELGLRVEQGHCSWPDSASNGGRDSSVDIPEDVPPAGFLKLVHTVVELYM